MENSKPMENSRSNLSLYAWSTGDKNIFKQSQNIVSSCDSTLASSAGFRHTQGFNPANKSKLPAYVFDPQQPNPQDKSQTDKYVEKLKSTSKKKVKPATIRKSELSENQLVFSN